MTAHDGTLVLLDNAPKGLRVRLQLAATGDGPRASRT
ncbi:hypothetical protein FHR88_001679 [Bradyrhizobium betae]|nr:hypothetical protein [Bradyrhizobium betae]